MCTIRPVVFIIWPFLAYYSGQDIPADPQAASNYSGEDASNLDNTEPPIDSMLVEDDEISRAIDFISGKTNSFSQVQGDVANSEEPVATPAVEVDPVVTKPTINRTHPASPCPGVFSYLGKTAKEDRWNGNINVATGDTLGGVRINVILNKPAHFLGSNFGEVSSVDNIQYTIRKDDVGNVTGPSIPVIVFIKYSSEEFDIPRVSSIELNGRQICPSETGSVPPLPISTPTPSSILSSSVIVVTPEVIRSQSTVLPPSLIRTVATTERNPIAETASSSKPQYIVQRTVIKGDCIFCLFHVSPPIR